MLSVEPQH